MSVFSDLLNYPFLVVHNVDSWLQRLVRPLSPVLHTEISGKWYSEVAKRPKQKTRNAPQLGWEPGFTQ